jgi:hypothetical protein
MAKKRRQGERRGGARREEPGLEQAVGSAETPHSYTGAPDGVPHPGAGAGKLPDAADQPTSGMNTSTGRGRGGGVAGGVYGGGSGTVVSGTDRAVGHERDAGATAGGVAVPFGRGSNLGGADQGMAGDIGGMSGGTLGGRRADEVAGIEQEQQPGLGGDRAQRPEDARIGAPGDAGGAGAAQGAAPERQRQGLGGKATSSDGAATED